MTVLPASLTVLPASLTVITTHVPAVAPLLLALIASAAALSVLHRWSAARSWTDQHRLAVITGALTASMAAGFVANNFPTTDLLGKTVLNIAVLLGLFFLRHRLSHHKTPAPRYEPGGNTSAQADA